MAARTLESHGYRVLTAPDAKSALTVADPADLLITDVIMPRMSGPDLAQAMLKRSPGLKVLYISGYTTSDLSHTDLPFGGGNLLTKPFTPALLALKVREVLDAKEFGYGAFTYPLRQMCRAGEYPPALPASRIGSKNP